MTSFFAVPMPAPGCWRRAVHAALAALLFGGAAGAARADSPEVAAERVRIAAARAAAEQRYADRERECRQRFIVTSCVEDAQRERRATLAALRREENLIDEGLRQSRAAERREALRDRAAAEAARAREAHARPAPAPASGTVLDQPNLNVRTRAPKAAPAPEDVIKSPGPLPGGGPRSAEDEARSRASYEAAQRAAAEHRAEVEAKNARRAAQKKPAAPLPVPAGEPASSAR